VPKTGINDSTGFAGVAAVSTVERWGGETPM
jgi:hypothetical protein